MSDERSKASTLRKSAERKRRITLVGDFIRNRRQALKISQQKLGQLLTPPVTTQFMSNIERGITPLPTHHLSCLARALKIKEHDLSELMEKELKLKFLGKIGGISKPANEMIAAVKNHDVEFINKIYAAYQAADSATQKTFKEVSAALLKMKAVKEPVETE